VEIHIAATNLPGRTCAPAPGFPGQDNIHVGVQRKDRPAELLDLTPGDAPSAHWTLDCTPVHTDSGVELRGRYIQNRLGGRFIYLSWVSLGQDGSATMFRRAKMRFDAIPPGILAESLRTGRLTARLALTDAKGHPLCASVRPPLVAWTAEPAG
jgi:hypothetical protein